MGLPMSNPSIPTSSQVPVVIKFIHCIATHTTLRNEPLLPTRTVKRYAQQCSRKTLIKHPAPLHCIVSGTTLHLAQRVVTLASHLLPLRSSHGASTSQGSNKAPSSSSASTTKLQHSTDHPTVRAQVKAPTKAPSSSSASTLTLQHSTDATSASYPSLARLQHPPCARSLGSRSCKHLLIQTLPGPTLRTRSHSAQCDINTRFQTTLLQQSLQRYACPRCCRHLSQITQSPPAG